MKTGINKKYWFFIFILLMVYFLVIHPLIIYDTDDWYNISYMRRALPIWKDFNPIKVFPETFMSSCGLLAAYLLCPVLGDYVYSVAIVCGSVVAIFILFYLLSFYSLCKKKWGLSEFESDCLVTIFLSLHFLVFKNAVYNNEYLFYAHDVTCYFHYIIPTLLNASLVMCFEAYGINNLWEKLKSYEKAGLCLGLYLSIFSNLYCSIILSSYLFCELVLGIKNNWEKSKRIKENIFSILQKNFLHFITLSIWGISLMFEAFGTRASNIRKGLQILETGNIFWNRIKTINKFELLLLALIFVAGCCFWMKKKQIEDKEYYIKIFFSGCLVGVYLILLSSTVGSGYIKRSDVLLGMFFYVYVFLLRMFAFLMKEYKIEWSLLVVCFVLFLQAFNPTKSFKDSNGFKLSWEQCYAVDMDLLEQVSEASKQGAESIELHVPVGNEATANWPHATYLGTLMSDTLYRHGVIDYPIQITVIPDNDKNKQFYLERKKSD